MADKDFLERMLSKFPEEYRVGWLAVNDIELLLF